MQRVLLIVLILSLLILPNLALGGSSDSWLVCDSSRAGPGVDKTMSGINYYCCGTGNANTAPYKWQTGSDCSYNTGCTCGSWSNAGCGQSPCSSSQMKQTRSCTPDCTQCTCSRCVGPSYSSWTNQGCGISCGTAGTCTANQQCQKRTDSYGCAADQYQCIDDASCGGGATTTTSTTTPTCNGNGICECPLSEDQINCPNDCKTTLEMYADGQLVTPSTYLRPNQAVKVIVSFNDSRYNSNQGFNLQLNAVIDDTIVWTENNGCTVCAKTLNEMGCNNCKPGGQWTGGKGSWTGTNIQVNMENGYAHIEFDATLPGASEISIGKHVLKVTPIIQGSIITLRAAEAQFNIADGLYVLINTIKDIFNKLTGLFVYPS